MWRAALAAAAALLLWSGGAAACAICLSAVSITPADRLDSADAAVIAAPAADGAWRIIAHLKGETTGDAAAFAELPVPAEPLAAGQGFLLLRDRLGHRWSSLAAVPVEEAEFLRRFVASPRPEANDPDGATWAVRLDLVASRLAHPDAWVAGFAHGVVARAPYRAIRVLARRFEPGVLREELGTETDPSRRAAYILLLGATGDADQRGYIAARLDRLNGAENATELSALLAADLELGGPASVDLLERRYLFDRTRNLAEVEAALLALGVHGNADRAIPRPRVVEAYRRFIRQRPPLAGYVAVDLARWHEWSATADYVALLNAQAITDPASAFAAASYVHSSPDSQARSRLAAVR